MASRPKPRVLELPVGGPEVWLLDAAAAGLDEAGLRDWARQLVGDLAAGLSSRSYSYPYGLVAQHDHPVGVDIERSAPVTPEFLTSICTPDERSRLERSSASTEQAVSLWSSKEALAKALGDALAYDPRRLESPMFWRQGRSGPWRALALDLPSGHVGWVCWRAEAADS